MPAAVVEITEMLGIDFDGAPPCQMLDGGKGGAECGSPSQYRIYSKCPCGASCVIFICSPCLQVLESGGAWCTRCHSVRDVTRYC